MTEPGTNILAGDIGGTSTRLACFQGTADHFKPLAEASYPSRAYGGLLEIIRAFRTAHDIPIEGACFGIAGVVRGDTAETTNLPWRIHGVELAALLGTDRVHLINDMEANVHGIETLSPDDFAVLNRGIPDPRGTIAVISAGTGLGESVAYWDGRWYQPLPAEAGHADFAPRNPLEAALMLSLRAVHGRVACERVISGPGIEAIYRFLRQRSAGGEADPVADGGDVSAAITRLALAGGCSTCAEALEMFVSLLGAEAGNLALRSLARGGIYLGGGIAPRIVDKLRNSSFMGAFTDKGHFRGLLESIPVMVILNDRCALRGAARYAFCR